jgi:hypothetical protein
MKSTEFQIAINRAYRAMNRYKKLLQEAEELFEERYGMSTSSCDTWIDTMEIGDGTKPTVLLLDKHMKGIKKYL